MDNVFLMRVGVIGINFKTADLPLREAIARGADRLAGKKGIFFSHSIVLLSTCNRTEIYFSASDLAEGHCDLLSFLRAHVRIPFEQHLYSYFGIDCFIHLCRVTAGLDSAILAETEIQRQVKVAYAESCAVRVLPNYLHYLFQKALKIAKGVRTHFSLEQGAPTFFNMLWKLGEQKFGKSLKDRSILLVGYSQLHRNFALFLAQMGATRWVFCTRYPEKAMAKAVGREELERWREYDWISCATRSDSFLVAGESDKSHLIFDLSMPRTVNPAVSSSREVTLWNIEEITREKKHIQNSDLERCEAFIRENAFRLYQRRAGEASSGWVFKNSAQICSIFS